MPSTRSIGDGSGQTPRAATASTRIAWGPVAVPANDARRSSASADPTFRLALIARRRRGSLPPAFVSSSRASAGSAASIDPSSLIARAASSTIASSASVRNRATSALRKRRSATIGGDAHAARRVLRERAERRRVADARQREAAGVPQVDVLVVVGGEHRDDRRRGRLVRDPSERLGGEEPDARRAVGEERNQVRRRRRVAQVADHLGRLRANLGVGVGQERREKSRVLRPVLPRARELGDAPDAVDSGQLVRRIFRRRQKRLDVAAAHELELRLLTDPHVDMPQERRHVGCRARVEGRRDERADFGPHRTRGRGRRIELPDASLVLRVPAGDPVGEVERAVGTELHADGQDAAEHDLVVLEREPGAVFLQLEAVDARAGGRTGKARDEEVVLPLVGERGARVVDHARWTAVVRRHRRHDVRRLAGEARLEHLLVHPDVVAVVLRVGVLAVLPVRAPAAVRSVRNVDETLGLALVIAVVVDADQVAVLVERELLQVADPGREHLEVRAVGLRAHDRALVRIGPALAGLVRDVKADVADLPVEPAVGTAYQAGHAVPAERGMDAVALADDDLAIDRAVVVVVLEPPHAGRRPRSRSPSL